MTKKHAKKKDKDDAAGPAPVVNKQVKVGALRRVSKGTKKPVHLNSNAAATLDAISSVKEITNRYAVSCTAVFPLAVSPVLACTAETAPSPTTPYLIAI